MALTYAQFITRLQTEVPNQSTLTLTKLREITIRQLRELSSWRAMFMENSATFTLGIGSPYLGEYVDSAVSGFPPDLMGIDLVYYKIGTQKVEVPPANSMTDLRLHNGLERLDLQVTAPHPSVHYWYDDKLWFAPKVTSAQALFMDYFKDATRDTVSGSVLTESSTTQTNPWFDRGELALRYAVLAEYYLLPAFRDEAQATACVQLRNRFLATLKDEHYSLKGSSQVAPMNMGGGYSW